MHSLNDSTPASFAFIASGLAYAALEADPPDWLEQADTATADNRAIAAKRLMAQQWHNPRR